MGGGEEDGGRGRGVRTEEEGVQGGEERLLGELGVTSESSE